MKSWKMTVLACHTGSNNWHHFGFICMLSNMYYFTVKFTRWAVKIIVFFCFCILPIRLHCSFWFNFVSNTYRWWISEFFELNYWIWLSSIGINKNNFMWNSVQYSFYISSGLVYILAFCNSLVASILRISSHILFIYFIRW